MLSSCLNATRNAYPLFVSEVYLNISLDKAKVLIKQLWLKQLWLCLCNYKLQELLSS